MNTYIALFRGINVGGKNILPMKELVSILENMDYKKVSYFIQSGNIIFQHTEGLKSILADQMSAAILQRFGFQPKILLLDKFELQDAVKANPFRTESGKTLHFYFLESPAENPNIEKLTSLQSQTEEFRLINNVFYLYAPDGIGRSKMAAVVEKYLGVPVTARNGNTVDKLAEIVHNLS